MRAPRSPHDAAAPSNQPVDAALRHLVGEARVVDVEELAELVEEPRRQGIFEYREQVGILRDHVARLRCHADAHRPRTQQRLGGAQHARHSDEVHLQHLTPHPLRDAATGDAGGVHERFELVDVREQLVDLRRVGHVARERPHITPELRGELLRARRGCGRRRGADPGARGDGPPRHPCPRRRRSQRSSSDTPLSSTETGPSSHRCPPRAWIDRDW